MPDHLLIEVLLSLLRKLTEQDRVYCELDSEAEAGQSVCNNLFCGSALLSHYNYNRLVSSMVDGLLKCLRLLFSTVKDTDVANQFIFVFACGTLTNLLL